MYTKLGNYKHILILFLIILIGFGLRSRQLNFPSIGYHGGKEHEYLSMAQEMKRSQDYIKRRIYFYHAFEEEPSMRLYPQPPMVSYQTLIAWKFLGENLWGPRLLNVIFGLLSIVVIYLIAFLLFNNTILSLSCAFLLAIMPLAVFFSRNLQPESPAFFFMILGNLFYLKFITSLKKRNLVFGGLSFSLAWCYKFSFLLGLLPLLLLFPFKDLFKEKKKLLKAGLAFLFPYLAIVVVIIWLKNIGQWEFEELHRLNLFEIFTPAYWREHGQKLWWYAKTENFTLIYISLALSGVIIAFSKHKSLLDRYIIGWFLTIIPYCMIFSDYINQHNYYQMPFLILVCIASVYAVSYVTQKAKELLKENFLKKNLTLFFLIVVLGISAPLVHTAITRMYGTVFLGIDVAGETLKELTEPGARIFLRTHSQGFGIARYARRYMGWTDDLTDFMNKERRFNIKYICFYPAEYALLLQANNPTLFEYIQKNYHTKEVGLTEEPSKVYYIILEKGYGSDPETFLKSFSGRKLLRTIYKVLGNYAFFYTLRQPSQEPQAQTSD